MTISYLTDRLFLYKVSRMYYIDNLSQNEISKRMGLSRPQVSRCLKKARDTGMVEINIHMPFNDDIESLSSRVSKALGLKDVVIAQVEENRTGNYESLVDAISTCASKFLPELVEGTKYVGVGWGLSIYKTVLAMEYNQSAADTCFVPLIGSIGMEQPHLQVNSIVDRIAEKFKSGRMFINNPAFMGDEKVRDRAFNDERFNSVIRAWDKIELAIIGLGVPIDNSEFLKSQFKREVVEKLIENKVVGDILGQFFDSRGEVCRTGLEKELMGLELDKLKNIENVVCICGGKEKIKGIIAASKREYFNILVTDHTTASGIMEEIGDDADEGPYVSRTGENGAAGGSQS